MSNTRPGDNDEPSLLVCPNGHTTWTTMEGGCWCHECSQMLGIDPEFDQLHDPETGEPITTNRVSYP